MFFLPKVFAAIGDTEILSDDPPALDQMLFVLQRGVNLLLISSGVFFVAMLFISAYKFSMSYGDPKGVQGAKQTLTYSVFGFLVILSSFLLLQIITGALGATSGGLGTQEGLFAAIGNAIEVLKDLALIGENP
jgi:hypothetical protein